MMLHQCPVRIVVAVGRLPRDRSGSGVACRRGRQLVWPGGLLDNGRFGVGGSRR